MWLIIYFAIAAVAVIADQITKVIAVKHLVNIECVEVIPKVLEFRYVENDGMAFGLLSGARWIFMTVSTVLIIAMALYLYLAKSEGKLYDISIAMIVSGGIGNMIDRIGLGYVVDFIDFRLINFAIFNGADSFVCVGAGLLMLALVRDMIKESKAGKV